MDYQVLEAQPDVLEAKGSVRRARAVRRSIHLTPFGEDFCRDGLGLHLSERLAGLIGARIAVTCSAKRPWASIASCHSAGSSG